jgi:gluconate 2-dehydrogenase alpha chain
LFDHSKLSFLRGGIDVTNAACFSVLERRVMHDAVVPKSVKATWGSEWKGAALYYYDRTGNVLFSGEHLAYRGNYMDLDPAYKDHFGDPLLRLTLDWRDNERRMAEFGAARAMEIVRAMGAKEVTPFPGLRSFDATRTHSNHTQGGAIMGTSPDRSVVNPFLQHWRISNLFVLGASSFPQNTSAGPTLTILAQTYRTADVVVDRYLKGPAALA